MKLSVLIPTLDDRRSLLTRALWHLSQQDGDFEVVVGHGDKGLGDKVNEMVRQAEGDYVMVHDDDDFLAADYMAAVLPLLDGKVDSVGYRILATLDGKFWLSIQHNPKNDFGRAGFRRGYCPKIPVRRALVVDNDIRMGNAYTDDWPFSEEIHNKIETSLYVPKHLYVYEWERNIGRMDTGDWAQPRKDVGQWPPSRISTKIKRLGL